jgi:DNA-binding MarR family transcriptional regulator
MKEIVMTKGKNSPPHSGRRGETYVKRLADQFIGHFPESDFVALEITNAIHACYNAQRAALIRMFTELSLTKALGRSTVIRAIHFAGRPLTHNEIGTELEITPGSVTYLVDGLERDGLAKRVVGSENRRAVYVELTPDGEELAGRMTPAVANFAGQMSNCFTQEEKELFRDLLFKYLAAAKHQYMQEEKRLAESLTKS